MIGIVIVGAADGTSEPRITVGRLGRDGQMKVGRRLHSLRVYKPAMKGRRALHRYHNIRHVSCAHGHGRAAPQCRGRTALGEIFESGCAVHRSD